jgi:hypothetical protein
MYAREQLGALQLLFISYRLILYDFPLGIVTSSDTAAFDGTAIDRFSLSRTTLTGCTIEGNDVYVAYDPCGGGASAAAIVMGFVDTVTRQFIVCGADAKQLSSDGAQEMFIKLNLEALRALPGLGNSRIIGIIESNFGGNVGASRIGNIMGEYPPVRIFTGDTTNSKRAGESNMRYTPIHFSTQRLTQSSRLQVS